MLSPELKKLKEKLEGKSVNIDENRLLEELIELDVVPLNESLSLSSNVCKTCGRPL